MNAALRTDGDAAVLDRWLQACSAHVEACAGDEPEWLGVRRREALARLAEIGFPSRKSESWRYTDARAIARREWEEFGTVPEVDLDAARAALREVPRVEGASLAVVVDGRFVPELSVLPEGVGGGGGGAGVRIAGLARLIAEEPAALETGLAAIAGTASADAPFADACTALFDDGLGVILPPGERLEAPLQVVFLALAGDALRARPARLYLQAGRGSECSLVQTHAGGGGATLAVSEMLLDDGAVVDRTVVQVEEDEHVHLAMTRAHLRRDAQWQSRLLALGGAIARDEVQVLLDGEGASCTLRGTYAVNGTRQADCQARVDHAVPHGTSRQFYRGVLDDRARGVFDGGVLVREGAQGTDAEQRNDNLVLSEGAHADTKPQLEILADDVQCRHGATIGELEEDAIFYLRARGIGKDAARRMLMRAFALAGVEGIRDEATRALVERLVAERFAQGWGA